VDDVEHGLPARKIYPQSAARGTYDKQGRLAGYYHGDEEVPQSEEQEEKWSLTIEEQRAVEMAHPATFEAMCSAFEARMDAAEKAFAAVAVELPAATK
jgi:hypothetical protein